MSIIASFFVGIATTIAGLFGYHADTHTNVQAVSHIEQKNDAPPAPVSGVNVSIGAASDADLSSDLSAIDAQIKSSTDDSASIDASLSDKPVAQTQ